MKTVTVEVQKDHIMSLSKIKKPILAIAELIWNGFDADANTVQIELKNNQLKELNYISVTDDGHGIVYEDALQEFAKLGGSWKKIKCQSRNCNRHLHDRRRGKECAFVAGAGGFGQG